MANIPLPPPPSPFCVVAWNARYVKHKLGEVQHFLDVHKPSILIISEAHLPPDHIFPNIYPYISEYKSYPMDNNKHDGLLIYIHPTISYQFVNHTPFHAPFPSKTVLCWLRCSSPMLPQHVLVCAAYIDPYEDRFDEEEEKFLVTSINTAAAIGPPLLIVGDLNSRHPSWSSANNVNGIPSQANKQGSFINTLLEDDRNIIHTDLTLVNTLFAYPAAPTHPDYDSVIDLALTSDMSIVSGFDVLDIDSDGVWLRSDHYPIKVTLQSVAPHPPTTNNKHKVWSTKNADWEMFNSILNHQLPSWLHQATSLLEDGDCTFLINPSPDTASHINNSSNQSMVDNIWSSLHTIIIRAANIAVGKHTTSRTSKAWYTFDPLLPSFNRDYHRAYKSLLRHKKRNTLQSNPHIVERYHLAKATYRDAASNAKNQCWRQIADKIDDKHKIVWAKWKLTNPSNLPPLSSFSTPACPFPSSPQQSLDNLASHFASISTIPNDPSFDIKTDIEVNHYHSQSIPPLPFAIDLVDLPFKVEDLVRQCAYVNLHTSLGPDDISPSFLRYGGDKLYECLYMFFRLCYNYGVLPREFVSANVVPIYKESGDKSQASNYRPISITSIVMRVFELLMLPSLQSCMTNANIPSHSQFGFTANRSTHDAIYTFLSEISHHVSDSFVPAVFLDIQKAYDRVWTKGLLYKLHKMGMRDHIYHFYKSLVSKRSFVVLHSGMKSIPHYTTDGVPQGCVSSPLLFNIYIHNICDHIHPLTRLNLFADDMLLFPRSSVHGMSCVPDIQASLDEVSVFASKWKIKFSTTKSNFIIFTTKPKANRITIPPLTLASVPLTQVQEYRYLGIVLDYKLSFTPHLTSLLKSLHYTSLLISRFIPSKSQQGPTFSVINRLVQAILIPKLTYCLPFITIPFNSMAKGKNKQLFISIKKAIINPLRKSLGLPFKAHHDSIFIESRILNLHYLQTHSCLAFAHRLLSIFKSQQNLPYNNNHHYTAQQLSLHLSIPNPPPHHPIINIQRHMQSIPSLSTTDNLLLIERPKLRTHLFSHFFHQWYAESTVHQHSLYQYYPNPNITPPPNLSLPRYLLVDSSTTATIRARMRFGRTLLNYYRNRIGYKHTLHDGTRVTVSALCHVCNRPETIQHAICDCSLFGASRNDCVAALSEHNITLSDQLILSYPTFPTVPKHAQPYIHSVLSNFLIAVRSNRQC
jgi:hypothetical protein